MHLLPQRFIEVVMASAGAIGLLILIAPTFGRKPRATADGWQFPVKPTCLLLYWLGLLGGISAVALGTQQLLASEPRVWTVWAGWASFAFGFVLVLLVLADWPAPLVLDKHGLLERGSASSRIRWEELKHVCEYRIRYDHGVVIHGGEGKQLVVADIAYDSEALLACLMQRNPVPFFSLEDELTPISLFGKTAPRLESASRPAGD